MQDMSGWDDRMGAWALARLRWAAAAAWRAHPRWSEETYYTAGWHGLLSAVQSFDATKGASLRTWISTKIHYACQELWGAREAQALAIRAEEAERWATGRTVNHRIPRQWRLNGARGSSWRTPPPTDTALRLTQLWPHLTPRQQTICARLIAGETCQEIATALGCTKGTIDAHCSAIRTRVQALETQTPPPHGAAA